MTTWVFRVSPDQSDLDALLAGLPATIAMPVRRYAGEISEGDQIFLWQGRGGTPSPKRDGIVAEGFVEAATRDAIRQTSAADLIPVSPVNPAEVRIRLARIELKARFQRNWFDYDPVMSSSMLVKTDTTTEFRLTDEESARVNSLWRRAKTNWTYAEAVAGMWAFKRTFGGQISRAPSSPVAIAAMRTGRVMQGMYNKVQHFRSMDPRDTRIGLTSNSLVDREVWARFFDAAKGMLIEDDIESEFARLWPDEDVRLLPPQPSPEAAAAELTKLGLDQLFERYSKSAMSRKKRPRTYLSTTAAFDRDPLVVAIARLRAEYRCEVPGCSHALFRTVGDQTFVEVHHIEHLADGGDDTPENVACVCPSHHREVHHGRAAKNIKTALLAVRNSDDSASVIP